MIKIRYTEGEYGWAERLGKNIARINNQPILNPDELFVDDIVRLGNDPDGVEPYPVITEIVYSRHQCKTFVEYTEEAQLLPLNAMLTSLGCECRVLTEPDDKGPGLVVVGHPEWVDPEMLAEGIGISQSNCEPDGVEEEEEELKLSHSNCEHDDDEEELKLECTKVIE